MIECNKKINKKNKKINNLVFDDIYIIYKMVFLLPKIVKIERNGLRHYQTLKYWIKYREKIGGKAMSSNCGCNTGSNNGSGYALILVLFILLVIIGASWLV